MVYAARLVVTFGAVIAALSGLAGGALGQGGERAAAQVLFEEGKELRKQGDLAAACPKFAESLRLEPTVGTRFNLADCQEQIGELASAWTNFLEVAAATEQAGQQKRAKLARGRADALRPRLPRMQLEITEVAKGMTVSLNGTELREAVWATKIPVDLGQHEVEAAAPGRRAWKAQWTIESEGAVEVVRIPRLEPAAPSTNAAPDGATLDDDDGASVSPLQTLGLVVGGVGIAGLGVGTAFGVVAMSKKEDVDELCPDESNCTKDGIDTNDEAKTAGYVSTVAFAAGGAMVAGGLLLWLLAPSDEPDATSAGAQLLPLPVLGPAHAGIVLRGWY